MNTLNEIGFNQDIPFEIVMQESTYSNTDKIETEIQLADSGYGQGQILVNPLHLASMMEKLKGMKKPQMNMRKNY